ncbi:MAG: NifU-like protein [candidate division WS6 bacterium OLB20]|uniref:NifU-like protein n=1 Tax=candidate division WS6 bacterium OLB20 TaxID=1617426 RepID=A0A136LVL1_9BACT|nr:MAG: NifU-like protein [candidate division WS6 bacterium OLB20]
MDMYREALLDHYQNPRNFGELVDADVTIELENSHCGDRVVLFLKFADGFVTEASFEGEGCAIAIAAGSVLTEHIIGKPVTELKDFRLEDLMNLLKVELTVSRAKCAALSVDALQKALAEN